MGNYAGVTGHAPMLPEWAAGFWGGGGGGGGSARTGTTRRRSFSPWRGNSSASGCRVSVLVIDYRHYRHWGDWKLDPEFWPDPPAMVREIDDLGARDHDLPMGIDGGKQRELRRVPPPGHLRAGA